MEEWCAQKRLKLLQDEMRIPTLQEIKETIESLPSEEAALTVSHLDLPLVFDCINDKDLTQVDLACDVLASSLRYLPLGETTGRFSDHLERSLKHPYTQVKLMALTELDRYTMNEDLILNLSRNLGLVHGVITCLGDGDLAVSKKAGKILTQVGSTADGVKVLLLPETLIVLDNAMNISEVVRLRVYEIFINMSKNSEESHALLVFNGLYRNILQDVNSSDILLKMNLMEMLSSLAVTPHGYGYLERQGVLMNLFKYLTEASALDQKICESGIIKFFAHIANWKPIEVFSKYGMVTNRLFLNLKSEDLLIYAVTLDALGHIAECNQGKLALDAQDQKIYEAITIISTRITNTPTDIQIRTLTCLENLLRLETNEHQFEKITSKWFSLLGSDPMGLIVKYCKNPIVELKLGGLGILHALSEQVWGQNTIKNTPGLLEFLLDRRSEHKKECKEKKFQIVSALSKSSVFTAAELMQMESFVKQGPFFGEASVDIALD